MVEVSAREVGDLRLGGLDLVKDCQTVLGWVIGGNVSAEGEATKGHGGNAYGAQG